MTHRVELLRDYSAPQHGQLSACPTIVDLIGYFFTDLCQFEKLLLDEEIFCFFCKLSIFGRLFSQIIRVVLHAKIPSSAIKHARGTVLRI